MKRIGYDPDRLAVFHRLSAEVRELNISRERISPGVSATRQARQRHCRVAELGELVRIGIPLRLPERIEQTDQSRSLPEIIMQVEQLKSAETRCPEICFYLFLVTLELKAARGLSKPLVHVEQSVSFQRVAKDFVVARLQVCALEL